MEDFHYKEYTEEESRIYNQAIDEIMKGLETGMSFDSACDAVSVDDETLKGFIIDDALKVMIAHLHYKNGLALEDVAAQLKVSHEKVHKANGEMIEDIAITTSHGFGMTNPDAPFGNA
jgi:hypothetical protein